MQELSATMEQVHTVKKYRQYYKEYKANPSDKTFFEEYKVQITLYENALSELKKSYSKLPDSNDILSKLDKLQEKRILLCKSIRPQNPIWMNSTKYAKTMEFICVRRWRDSFHLYSSLFKVKSPIVFLLVQ